MSLGRLTAILVIVASAASADTLVNYTVAIDTSSQSGNNGAIYFQFAPGLNADYATVAIDGFSLGAPGELVATPPPFSDGNVSGSLDSLPLAIDNSQGLNDYEHYLIYGSKLTFHVTFDIPDVLMGQSGSEFLWQLTAPDGITPVLTQDQSGNLGTISYDQAGAFTTDTLGNDAIETISAAASPEPGTLILCAVGVLLLGWRVRAQFQSA